MMPISFSSVLSLVCGTAPPLDSLMVAHLAGGFAVSFSQSSLASFLHCLLAPAALLCATQERVCNGRCNNKC
ncbi:hypothetical protein BD289DRAFT_428282 [Coniella lustricola]|uniref:Uncharacterized protein n=1 Tax=Coniella lustricola TaxID=2025994 RepID=A0A2T3AE70_9PEZI|nr:hypothetical protein BD289DRAFT_428282 [Coniella lustricola]